LATYNDVMAKIGASTKEDWVLNHDETQRTYKGDLNIRIVDATEQVPDGDARVHEPWVQMLSSTHEPVRRVFDIYYGNSFVRWTCPGTVDTFPSRSGLCQFNLLELCGA
jgi:hypothetical protein